jgi:transcriptional regulator with XRE-family HTH domain
MQEGSMHFFDAVLARHAADFKAAVWQSLQDNKVTQTDIAGALGIDQGTVSRWMNIAGDLHLPAFTVPLLSSDRLKILQQDILRYLVGNSGYRMGSPVQIVGSINGSVEDEAMELAIQLGKIAERVRNNHVDIKSTRRAIAHMRDTLDRMDVELNGMEHGHASEQ